jgi:hypothetical protein
MIASSFLLIMFLIYYIGKVSLRPRSTFSIIFIVLIGYFLIPISVQDNLISALDRLTTVEAIGQGDLTAEGTSKRLDIRGPRVLTNFEESPLLGFGYGNVSASYYDGHVGNHSLLLLGGVVGLTIVWLTVIALIAFFFRLDGKKFGRGIFVFGLALMAIMIIHSSSRSMVSYVMDTDAAFLIALIFNHVNAVISDYKKRFDFGKGIIYKDIIK